MKTLEQNITAIFGNKGEEWLNSLPIIIEALCAHWHLSELTPVNNMTFNYVAKALCGKQPVALKISCDKSFLEEEMRALIHFNGHGSIKYIDHHSGYNALLLQQAIPATTLKSLYPAQIEFVMDRYVETMQKLHYTPLPQKHTFRHINDWLQTIDKISSDQITDSILTKAVHLKNNLLALPAKQIVLHGDLHHDNILKNGNEWISIDPKGIIGVPEFEIAAFDFIHNSELENQDVRELFESRVERLAQKALLDPQHIKDWVFVRLILSAAWSIGDGTNPTWAIKLASMIG